MKTLFYAFFILSLAFSTQGNGTTFGYISYTSMNIGDDIQSIAAMRFLPKNAIPVEREYISQFSHPTQLKTVVNGWFMHHKNGGFWDLDTPPPSISWPPSTVIDPFFISIHFYKTFLPVVFAPENIEYLKKYAPIGARDMSTLRQLRKHNIESYFSGCLTLTLQNDCQDRNDIIYLVDLDDDLVNYIKSKTNSTVITLSHGKTVLRLLKVEHRLKYAEYLLNLYRKCKCVVTNRLHATMPCLAFHTPVLLINPDRKTDPRFEGLDEHAFHCSKDELMSGEYFYDFNNPPQNPNTHIPIRDELIKRMTEWVQKLQEA